MKVQILLILSIGVFCCIVSSDNVDRQKIELTAVQNLKFYKGLMTSSRRKSPVQQLKCVGGSYGCLKGTPDDVECTNRGTDSYGKVQWECIAKLPDNAKFGVMTVCCEGYENKDDPFVLVGSCGLEYNLEKKDYDASGNNQTVLIIVLVIILVCGAIITFIYFKTGATCPDTSNQSYYRNNRTYYSRTSGGGSSSGVGNYSFGFASTSNR